MCISLNYVNQTIHTSSNCYACQIMNDKNFFWYDLETTGTDIEQDRAVQFAGIRTDSELNQIEDGYELFCQPPLERLPAPQAVAITKLDYLELVKKSLGESEFCRLISSEFTRNKTCVSGFNNIRFDDEIIRRLFYRNLRDPYAREWQSGNCRWDLIDPMRAAYALRPDGIEWPKKENGSISFRLEDLARANNVLHENAHDALSDVRATIGVARALKKAQPKLFDFSLTLRQKSNVASLLNLRERQPAVLISAKIKRWKKNLGLILPLTYHPFKANNIICFDLSCDPAFIQESADESLFESLNSDSSVFIEINISRVPFVAPVSVLDEETIANQELDLGLVQERIEFLNKAPELTERIQRIISQITYEVDPDPENQLYSGGFFNSKDREVMNEISESSPSSLKYFSEKFDDPRLKEMLFRYTCRNFPQVLDETELDLWKSFVRGRLENGCLIDRYKTEAKQIIETSDLDTQRVLRDLLNYYDYVEGLVRE